MLCAMCLFDLLQDFRFKNCYNDSNEVNLIIPLVFFCCWCRVSFQYQKFLRSSLICLSVNLTCFFNLMFKQSFYQDNVFKFTNEIIMHVIFYVHILSKGRFFHNQFKLNLQKLELIFFTCKYIFRFIIMEYTLEDN